MDHRKAQTNNGAAGRRSFSLSGREAPVQAGNSSFSVATSSSSLIGFVT